MKNIRFPFQCSSPPTHLTTMKVLTPFDFVLHECTTHFITSNSLVLTFCVHAQHRLSCLLSPQDSHSVFSLTIGPRSPTLSLYHFTLFFPHLLDSKRCNNELRTNRPVTPALPSFLILLFSHWRTPTFTFIPTLTTHHPRFFDRIHLYSASQVYERNFILWMK